MNREQIEEAQRVAALIIAYIGGDLTEKQRHELDQWIGSSDDNLQLFDRLTDETQITQSKEWFERIEQEAAQYNITLRIKRHERKRRITRTVSAVAAVIFLAMLGIYASLMIERRRDVAPVAAATPKATGISEPEGVVLITGTGKRIPLGKQNRIIDLGSDASAEQNEQGLSYSQQESSVTNTLMVPAGSQYQLRLADGTKVWLNAQSSLEYPSSFHSSARIVKLHGEAFFEVAKEREKPFTVATEGTTVNVLGTSFNVHAYPEFFHERVTLLDGAVEVRRQGDRMMLRPGEQATLVADGRLTKQSVDTKNTIAWTKGLFVFHDASIESVMEEVSVWYGKKIKYLGRPSDAFSGIIQKNSTLEQVLRMLEISGAAHFSLSDSVILVRP